MTKPLTYKGYSARVEFDAEDRVFFGRLTGIADLVTFHSESAAGVRRNDRPTSIRVAISCMAARLPDALETKPFQYFDHLSSGDDWQSVSHD